ncbi:MAG: adenosine deaminase [Candidatus Moranbacteria bacterium]|nr:adenosine deaminase [Candidatus Moranbacteria bacterium]
MKVKIREKDKLDQKFIKNFLRHDLIDLHIHIGGAMSPHTLWEIAHSQGIKLPVKDYWDFVMFLRNIDNMEDLHKVYEWTEKIQSSPKAIERGIYNVISKEYRSANVSVIELRFNPLFRTRGGEIDMDHIIHAAIRGMERAMLDYGVKAGLIFCLDRRLHYDYNKIIMEKAVDYKDRGVVGIDITGPEEFYFKKEKSFKAYKKHFKENIGVDITNPKYLNFEDSDYLKQYIELFKKAKQAGLGITVHTGEAYNTTGERVIKVIEAIKPDRIGHGIKAAWNQKAMKMIKKNRIVLEVCPSMNLLTGTVKDWQEMRFILKTFLANDIEFAINTDGPYLAQTGLAKEFKHLFDNKVLSQNQLMKCLDIAKKASFIDN